MNVVADGMTIIVALRHFSKRFAARATQLGSDALARSLSLLASQQLIASAGSELLRDP